MGHDGPAPIVKVEVSPGEEVMELTLSNEEHELLVDILEHRRRELTKEISHTDHHEFKVGLRKSEKLIESMLSRLRAEVMAKAS